MNGVALAVAEYLDFDVARLAEIFLDIDRVVAECGLGLGARGRQCGREFLARFGDLHAAPAATGGGLDQNRVADFVGDFRRLAVVGDAAVGARHDRNAQAFGGALGFDLVAHDADMLGLGTDEVQAVVVEDLGKARVLGQKAVAGMHGVGAGDLAGRENGGHVEIGVFRRRRADADAFVGKAHMHGVGVGGGMHRDGLDAKLLAGAQDSERDFAAVGDEDFIEHCLFEPLSTSW